VILRVTSSTLSTEIISFSVSVKVVKKPFSNDTTGAAYDKARPTSPGVAKLTRELLWKLIVAIMAINRMIKPANNWSLNESHKLAMSSE